MQSSQLFVACIQCWHARCMCVLFSYNIIQLWCIQCDTIFTIRSHIRRLGWPQLWTPWHVEAGLLYSEHYYVKLWHSEASLNHAQHSEAYLGILCQLLAQFHKFTNCQCHPMAFTFQPYDSIQASRNKSQIVQTIVYKFLPCILVSLSTYIDARLYFLSKFSSHYSDLHTSILSLASTWNINLRTRVKENPMRFQCKSISF